MEGPMSLCGDVGTCVAYMARLATCGRVAELTHTPNGIC